MLLLRTGVILFLHSHASLKANHIFVGKKCAFFIFKALQPWIHKYGSDVKHGKKGVASHKI